MQRGESSLAYTFRALEHIHAINVALSLIEADRRRLLTGESRSELGPEHDLLRLDILHKTEDELKSMLTLALSQ